MQWLGDLDQREHLEEPVELGDVKRARELVADSAAAASNPSQTPLSEDLSVINIA